MNEKTKLINIKIETKINNIRKQASNKIEYSLIINALIKNTPITKDYFYYFCYIFSDINIIGLENSFRAAVLVIKHYKPDYCIDPDFDDETMYLRNENLNDANQEVIKIYNKILEHQRLCENLKNF